jgi:GTP cyclohydrolase II
MDLKHGMAAAGLSLISLTPVEIRGHVWVCIGFEEADRPLGDHPHLAFVHARRDWVGESDLGAAVLAEMAAGGILARIHSECILGDAFGSSMCDCGEQLRLSMDEMARSERGVFIYLRQEGRGIGLRNKLGVLALQYGFVDGRRVAHRHSSDEANLAMGFKVDHRSYETAAAFLRALGIGHVRLVTGNPDKIADLAAEGIVVDAVLDLYSHAGVSARAAAEIAEKVSRGYIYQR